MTVSIAIFTLTFAASGFAGVVFILALRLRQARISLRYAEYHISREKMSAKHWETSAQRWKTLATKLLGRIEAGESHPEGVRILDAKTTQLVRLAVNNSNEHEARNAALAACRHLHKEMKL